MKILWSISETKLAVGLLTPFPKDFPLAAANDLVNVAIKMKAINAHAYLMTLSPNWLWEVVTLPSVIKFFVTFRV